MMKDKFLIGELAKIFDISTDTLRYYDKVDLLKPDYDVNNKYRYYSIEKFFLLSRILFLKSLNIPLKDIKTYFDNQSTTKLLKLLDKEELIIDQKIKTLNNLKIKIENKRNLIKEANNHIDNIRIEYFPKRYGVFIDIENIENKYEIKNSFKKNEPHFKMSSWLAEGQIYTSITKEDMLREDFSRFNYFIELIPDDIGQSYSDKVIEENKYACVVFCGPYSNMDVYYNRLLKWIKDNGYEVIGDSIEKNIVDYGFSNYEEEYISEIQIPIEKII